MSFAEAVYDAVRVKHPEDSRSAVHEVVGKEFSRLDPGVQVSATEYFAHSFVPDFVVSWGPADARKTRDVYLRLNVTSSAFQPNYELLRDTSPVFIGVLDERAADQAQWQADDTDTSLVTQARALGELEEVVERDSRTVAATREVVRQGFGFLDSSRADALSESYRAALGAIDQLDPENLDETSDLVSDALALLTTYIAEPGTVELEQTLHALWIKSGGDPFEFPTSSGWDPTHLSHETLQRIVLDLLDSGKEFDDEMWHSLIGHVRAEDIGRLLDRPLFGGTFDGLVQAMLPRWTASWVWVEEKESAPLIPSEFAWLVDGGNLGLDLGPIRAFFADDGRHFKDKPRDLPLPRLRDAVELLNAHAVTGVALRTASEDVEFSLRETGNVPLGEAVVKILAEPQSDRYAARSLRVRVPEASYGATVLYDERKIDLDEATKVRDAAVMARAYFGRDEVDENSLLAFLENEAQDEEPK